LEEKGQEKRAKFTQLLIQQLEKKIKRIWETKKKGVHCPNKRAVSLEKPKTLEKVPWEGGCEREKRLKKEE